MTTPSTERKAGPLLGTGAQTTWPFTFKVFAATDIAVTIADSLGVETALAYGVDYTVSLNANQETSPGGTVTYPISGSPLPVGSRLVIIGNLPYDQPLDLPAGGNFSPLALENELDRLAMQIQQLRENVGRALQVSVTTGANVGLPAPTANQLIGWNASGNNLQNVPLASLATSVAFATMRYDTFTGDGVETQFALSADPAVIGNLDIAVGGVTQTPGTDYTLASGALVFTAAPPLGVTILARYGEALPPGQSVGANDVAYIPGGFGAIPTNVEEMLRRPGVDVRDYGAVGDGVTNDLQAIKDARDQAGVLGVPLLFSPGVYGVNDAFSLTAANCTVVVFQPGAEIKLLSNTTVGGVCSVWDGQPTTEQVYIFNATVDCQNFPGENAMSCVHPVGSTFYNLTVRNCQHDDIQPWYGGKGIQWEGPERTPNSKLFNFVAENCTIGIDIGTPDGADKHFTHIGVFNASMYNVDIPVHINNTITSTAPDLYDSLELYVDGLQCRNCGKLTYPTASATGGGVIVMERGYKTTVRNLQVVNDQGTYGTTSYGGIGALVRGQGKGLVLENVLFSGDSLTAIFDFNPADFQSPFGGDIASYVLANNIRVYGNLDFVVKCLPGGGKLGKNIMRQVEIGSSVATLAGVVDANAGAYNDSFLELIDRDNNFASTGLLNFKDIYLRGNAITGANAIAGRGTLAQFNGEWTPTDGSTDALTFAAASGWWFRIGDMATVMGFVTYPTTAASGNARIGSLPFPPRNLDAVIGGGGISRTTTAAVGSVIPEKSSNKATVVSPAGAAVPNSSMSGQTIAFTLTYPIRIDY